MIINRPPFKTIPLEGIKISTVCIGNSSLIYILIAIIIKINKTHSFSLVFLETSLKPYQVVASSSLFECLCVKLIESVLDILISPAKEEGKRKKLTACCVVQATGKVKNLWDGCKSTVITLKCVRLVHCLFAVQREQIAMER
jgi:hypothetical protein